MSTARTFWRAAAALLAVAAAAAPTRAWANGRFPGARQIALSPSAPGALLLRTTFGQMLTHDDGKRFDWICESAIGYGGTQDPAIAISADGSLFNAAYEGTTVSHDGGCSFDKAAGVEGRYGLDLALDATTPARLLLTVAASANDGLASQCWQTIDNGKTWQKLSDFPGGFFPQNVDVARSDPKRIYASGILQIQAKSSAVLLRSDDGGTTWAQHAIDLGPDSNVYLSAIDPTDPDRLYLRTEGKDADRLLLSTDGGGGFQAVATLAGGMLGFALSPDGSLVAIGGPSGGVLVAPRETLTFEQRSPTPVTCLAWGPGGLYACGTDELASGFALGRSRDEGKSFVPLLAALGDSCGPLTTCAPASPYAAQCPAQWPALRATLKSTTGPSNPACMPSAPTAGSPGTEPPDAGPDAAGGSGGAAGAGGAGGAASGGPPEAEGGCALARPGAPPSQAAFALLGLVAALGRRRLRRISASRPVA